MNGAARDRVPERVDDGVVRIRRPEPGDAPAVHAAVERSRTRLQVWMPWCTPDYSRTDAEAWILASAGDWPDGPLCPFIIESLEDGELIGCCSIDRVEAVDGVHKLGYWIRSDRTGRGLARRAARLAAGFAFDQLEAARIDILVAADNQPSLAVAEAVGARREGLLARRFLLQGRRHDAVILGLLPEWLTS
ncbi:MAG: GNAT family protein [Gammaproteobacteria bacterium]|nr:GNAT family protein [Gammaproteobacteria bacterium]